MQTMPLKHIFNLLYRLSIYDNVHDLSSLEIQEEVFGNLIQRKARNYMTVERFPARN